MLAPRDEVVHLLDLDPTAEPAELRRELLAAFLDGARPDLRRDGDVGTPTVERRAERALGAAVHRRRVDQPRARLQRRRDDVARERRIAAERLPRAEADDGPEPPLLHHAERLLARRPAANAAAKNSGSSSGPRPMCESGSPAHASRQRSRLELVRDERRRETDAQHRLRVMREPAVTRPRVASRHPRRQHRPAAERGGRVDRLGGREAAVPQRRSRADDARADRADDRVGACGSRVRERRVDVHRLHVARRRTARRRP